MNFLRLEKFLSPRLKCLCSPATELFPIGLKSLERDRVVLLEFLPRVSKSRLSFGGIRTMLVFVARYPPEWIDNQGRGGQMLGNMLVSNCNFSGLESL